MGKHHNDMDIHILIWLNTAIIIFAVIVEGITIRASWQALREVSQISREVAQNQQRNDDIKRLSLATLERIAAGAPRAS